MKSTIDSSHKARSSTETGTINQRKNQITLSSSRLTTDSFIFQCVIETVQVVHGFLVFKALKVLIHIGIVGVGVHVVSHELIVEWVVVFEGVFYVLNF